VCAFNRVNPKDAFAIGKFYLFLAAFALEFELDLNGRIFDLDEFVGSNFFNTFDGPSFRDG
jgi:hypothetical protein